MRITSVSTLLLSAPIPEANRSPSDLGTMVKNDTALVQVQTDEGITGLGVAQGRRPEVLRVIVEQVLQPLLVGEDPTWIERLWEKMYNGVRFEHSIAHGFSQPGQGQSGDTMCAIAGVDIALWDIWGKVLGQPIYRLMGATRDCIRGYASEGKAPVDLAGEEAAAFVAKGYTAIKVRDEGRDGFSIDKCVRRVAAARKAVGPDIDLMVDAHAALDTATAVRLAKQLEEYDLTWFEEPIGPDNHEGLAALKTATTVPIATGERETTRFAFRDLLARGLVDVIQPDIAIAGGFTEVRRITAMASAHHVRFAPHVWGSGPLFAASLHTALASPNCVIFEVPQSRNAPLINELFTEPFDIRDGYVHAPTAPGLGYTLRPDVAERFPYVPGHTHVLHEPVGSHA